jgi:hypothetical protein|tara:strand:- start:4812 stop:5108 length:297 start_codon:yes stop_codon:yes gene_type:complete
MEEIRIALLIIYGVQSFLGFLGGISLESLGYKKALSPIALNFLGAIMPVGLMIYYGGVDGFWAFFVSYLFLGLFFWFGYMAASIWTKLFGSKQPDKSA